MVWQCALIAERFLQHDAEVFLLPHGWQWQQAPAPWRMSRLTWRGSLTLKVGQCIRGFSKPCDSRGHTTLLHTCHLPMLLVWLFEETFCTKSPLRRVWQLCICKHHRKNEDWLERQGQGPACGVCRGVASLPRRGRCCVSTGARSGGTADAGVERGGPHGG